MEAWIFLSSRNVKPGLGLPGCCSSPDMKHTEKSKSVDIFFIFSVYFCVISPPKFFVCDVNKEPNDSAKGSSVRNTLPQRKAIRGCQLNLGKRSATRAVLNLVTTANHHQQMSLKVHAWFSSYPRSGDETRLAHVQSEPDHPGSFAHVRVVARQVSRSVSCTSHYALR